MKAVLESIVDELKVLKSEGIDRIRITQSTLDQLSDFVQSQNASAPKKGSNNSG